jgi:hypothetical protein
MPFKNDPNRLLASELRKSIARYEQIENEMLIAAENASNLDDEIDFAQRAFAARERIDALADQLPSR